MSRSNPFAIRALLRQPFTPAAATSPARRPACAFAAPVGHESAIHVTVDIGLTFPVTGQTLSFAAGTTVELLCPEQWQGGDSLVIVATSLLPERRLLLALPRRLHDPDDIVLGGFDLDATGAVLAGSFWDANLTDQPSFHTGKTLATANPEAADIIARMADVFVTRQRDGHDDTTDRDLVREGFAETEIVDHYDAAASRAAARQRDLDVAADRTRYDRQARVMLGAVAVAGEFNPNRMHTTLRLAGLTTREIGNLFDDIIGESMKLLREGHAALAGAA